MPWNPFVARGIAKDLPRLSRICQNRLVFASQKWKHPCAGIFCSFTAWRNDIVPGRSPSTDGKCMDCLSVFILSPFYYDLFRGDPQHLIQLCLLCLVLAGGKTNQRGFASWARAQADGNAKTHTHTDTDTHTHKHKHKDTHTHKEGMWNIILFTYS